jgi:excisionase family DNA binding protein
MGERLLTVPEVAERLHVGKTTVWEMIYRGELPSLLIGRSRRVREVELDEWIRRQAVPA